MEILLLHAMALDRDKLVQGAIEQTIRKSGVRRRRYADVYAMLGLADGLREYGIPAQAVSRLCYLVSSEGGNASHSPEQIPALMLGDVPTDLHGGRGWDEVVANYLKKKDQGNPHKFYSGRVWEVQWRGDPTPAVPGPLYHAMKKDLADILRACMTHAQALEISAQVAPAPSPSRRPRF